MPDRDGDPVSTPELPRGLERVPSPILVLTAIASVQFGSAVASKLFREVGGGGAVLLRLVSASIVLLLLWRPRVRRMTRGDWALVSLFGFVLAAMNLSFYHALARIPLGIGVTLEFVGPLTVAVLGSRRRQDLIWVGLAAAGIAALSRGNGHGLDGLGVGLALLAGGFWGCYILLGARVGAAIQGGTGLAVAMTAGTLVALPFGIVEGGTHLLTAHALLVGGAVGILSSVVPYSLELEALRRIRTATFGVLMSIEPAMAALAGALILGQGLSLREGVGIALVISASLGASQEATHPPNSADGP